MPKIRRHQLPQPLLVHLLTRMRATEPIQPRTPIPVLPAFLFASHPFDGFSPLRREPVRSGRNKTTPRQQLQNGSRVATAPANAGNHD
jgi:hypothetical protein